MKRAGASDSGTAIRHALRPLQRITTTFTRQDGRTLHVRKTALADDQKAVLHHAMGAATQRPQDRRLTPHPGRARRAACQPQHPTCRATRNLIPLTVHRFLHSMLKMG